MSLRSVRKRDGTEVAYDKARIQAAVAAAQSAVGEEDEAFAGEVASLVEFALRRRYGLDGSGLDGSGTPGVEEIQDLVEQALIQLGRANVAKAYILYRDRRARVREARALGREGTDPALLATLRVREAEGSSPWSKGRIIAALVDEAGLSRTLAEEVAVRVEKRVVSSGLKRITTALVRELVDNELVAMGLAKALARHEPVSLPRHDLRRLLELGTAPDSAPAPPRWLAAKRLGEDALESVVAGEILRRFALEDVLEERTVERCAAGELYVEDLRRPHLHLVQSVPCELFARGEPGARSAFELLDEVAELSASVSHGLVLEGASAMLQPILRAGRTDAAGGLGGWLLALRALARATGKRIDLSRLGARSPALIARLCDELAELTDYERGVTEPEPLPRLFLDRDELRAALEHRAAQAGSAEGGRRAIDALIAQGLVVPTWSRPDELFAGPGCRRRGREQGALACGGAVALNLARAARRAGPWREDLWMEELARLVEAAVEALAQLAAFQRRARAARAGEARGRVAYALTPVGLREALRVLGDGEVRPAQGARALGLVSEAARRFASKRGLSVVLSPFFGERAARRFARIDAAEPRVSQHLLFGELARGVAGRASALSTGFDLGSAAERYAAEAPGEAEAELFSTVPTGAWLAPMPDLSAAHGASPLEAWERFDQLREERRATTLPTAGADREQPALFPAP